jgi:hypothetical protein
MEERLAQIRAYSLSNQDINDILEPDTKIITYPEFGHMESIDEAFDSLGRCVFLFLTQSESSGHWLTMFKRPEGIFYFDSYGEKPEAQREWLTEEQLEDLGEAEPYLMNLLKASGYKVYWNTHRYQKEKDDYNSCGRWCVARLICKDMSDKQFYNVVKEGMKEYGVSQPDDWACLFSFQFLGK